MIDFKELINKAIEAGFSDVQVSEASNSGLALQVYNGVVEKNVICSVASADIRGIYNGKMASLSLEDYNADIEWVIDTLKKNATIINTNDKEEIFAGSDEYPIVEDKKSDFDEYTVAYKIDKLLELETKAKEKDSRVSMVPYCVYEEESFEHKIYNSKGLDLSRKGSYCTILIQVIVKDGEKVQSGFEADAKVNLKDLDFDKIVDKAVERATFMLDAKPVESSTYDCIIENEAMGSLFGAFDGMYNGEAAMKQIAYLADKVGQKVFSDKISIVDDPLIDHKDVLFKQTFDDDGVACYTKDIVKEGVFVGMIHNLKTAKAFNATSTGNASGVSVSGENTYIVPGNKTKEELIATIENGLLIQEFDGLHAGVNEVSGDFNLKCSGARIENGKITTPVTLVVMAGNFFNMLKDGVEEVGSDLKFSGGCGSPSIKFKGLTISGE